MKEYRNVISRTVRQLLLCGGLLLASCSQDNDLTDTSLPEGMYPLELTASIAGTSASSTRATTDNIWKGDGTEKVAVRVSTSPIENEYTLHQYTVRYSSLGMMTSDKPYYWQNTSSSIWLRAWYPYQETLSSFTVPADQSTEAGFQRADFLCTEITEEFFNFPINIEFYHQTAKVVVNIKKEGIMADSPEATVTLGCDDDNNKLYLTGSMDPVNMSPPTNYSGLAANTDGGQGVILPLAVTDKSDEYAATYQALLIPQDIGGKKFIAITAGGVTCYYTPPTGTTLEGGYSYMYNVTLDTEGDVTVNNITVSPWTNHEGDIPLVTE